ncbi:Penicillin G acylase precursor [compost metagenome]
MNLGTQNNMTVFTGAGAQGYEVAAPGQSGFVAPDGQRSPHYADQLQLLREQGKRRTWLSEEEVERNTVERQRLRL